MKYCAFSATVNRNHTLILSVSDGVFLVYVNQICSFGLDSELRCDSNKITKQNMFSMALMVLLLYGNVYGILAQNFHFCIE